MIALRVGGAALAVGIVLLWLRFVQGIFAAAAGMPAPGAFMVPTLFSCLAIAGGVAAARAEGIVVVVTGALSFVPVGLYLTMFEGTPRWIGLLDLGLVAVGVLMVRRDRAGTDGAEPEEPTVQV